MIFAGLGLVEWNPPRGTGVEISLLKHGFKQVLEKFLLNPPLLLSLESFL